jgi:tellurite methyltransferase
LIYYSKDLTIFKQNNEILRMSSKDKEKWNHKYGVPEYITGKEPVEWLKGHSGLLKGKGSALDIASGEGRNAVFVAENGYQTLAVDISTTGLEKAHALADEKGVSIKTQLVDLDNWKIKQNAFDLILCFNFLDRRIFPAIKSALKPGGLIFYETFTIDYLKYSSFKREWVLEHNELLDAFSELRILSYREVDTNDKAFASLIAIR